MRMVVSYMKGSGQSLIPMVVSFYSLPRPKPKVNIPVLLVPFSFRSTFHLFLTLQSIVLLSASFTRRVLDNTGVFLLHSGQLSALLYSISTLPCLGMVSVFSFEGLPRNNLLWCMSGLKRVLQEKPVCSIFKELRNGYAVFIRAPS